MIEAIVFDFDGVLADSEPAHLSALAEVLAGIGITITAADYYARYLGLDDAGALGLAAEENGLTLDPGTIAALIERKAEIFDRAIVGGDVLFPGARACVERLAARYPLGIASGALRHEIETILAGAGLSRFFDFIVASGETPRGKPHPDPYRRAAELHGRPPHACLAIEDSRWGIESARGAELRCIGITTSYGPGDLPGAELIVSSLDQLTAELVSRI
jgi:HAD superfamily hydrolase (TIGR01509 family)